MTPGVLAVNAEASGMKLELFAIGEQAGLVHAASLVLDGIGTIPHLRVRSATGSVLADRRWKPSEKPTQADFLSAILDFAEHALGRDSLVVVGHLVAHGGGVYRRATRVTPALLDGLEQFVPLAPRRQPACLAPIRTLMALRPGLPQIACFDTAFHHTLPAEAMRLGLPRDYYTTGVRRFGFHGLSYEYIVETVRQQAPRLARGRMIALHLADEASLCAMFGGKSFDVTMGFSALDGVMTGTRCGALDPGVILYLLQHRGMSVAELEHLLYHQSGLLGVSGISGDIATLEASTDPRAREALAVFALRIVREIGGLSAILDGLDGLVFTGSIGAQSPRLRREICGRLRIPLDHAKNDIGLGKISTRETGLEVWVIPTDEEAMIARHASLYWMNEAARPAPGRVPAKR
jgi:acetate kinase